MPQSDDAAPARGRGRWVAFLPLLIFAALSGVFLLQLLSGRDASEIPSALIGANAPALDLPALDGLMRDGQPVPALQDETIDGALTLVNVWASWCVPCRQEHPLLMDLAERGGVKIVGINYKDRNGNAVRFLGELGNPYDAVGVDQSGRTAIDWGVYGVPESYLVDADGTIIYKKVGPFSEESYVNELLPEIEAARSGA
ncbi:DsbE family thiol:disulfide interchange protein [Pararhizobium haloflavum]|uniref:DsbE family thiol:disulfide interchange protein n=1 Tax=Pararhizobium haloflavum TaxID=2037914 RepID=UPI000C195FB8|nr:DsbE family thiol:disulfide interchange protein [Pararhizobium haloflavum]